MEDLWPKNVEKTELKAPIAILKEQASFLGKKTQNIVEAEVERIPHDYWMEESGFAYSFYIVGQALSYKYNLFKINHGVAMYPLQIRLDDDILGEIKNDIKVSTAYSTIQVESEKDFLDALKIIFNSTKARQIVQAILAQSGEKPVQTF